jgi:AhpD family alkylhydroperoxidase
MFFMLLSAKPDQIDHFKFQITPPSLTSKPPLPIVVQNRLFMEGIMSKVQEFNDQRQKLNDLVLQHADKEIKRFFSLDGQVYRDDVLPRRTKEMLGLVASLVLRCDDCINYHLGECHNQGITTAEIEEIFSVGLIVGGSITIPHIRRGFAYWSELQKEGTR